MADIKWSAFSSAGTIASGDETVGLSGGANVRFTADAFATPALGTPTSCILTNATGLPISTGVSGLGAGVATFLATPSSANLATAVTDETGSGALVFGTSPSLVTPLLGTPTSGVLTNCTGLPMTSGVTGVLPVANGGTNLSSTTANQILYSSSANTITGLATGNSGLLVTSAAGVPSIGNAILADITVNTIPFGLGTAGVSSNMFIGTSGNASATGGPNYAFASSSTFSVLTSGNGNVAIGFGTLTDVTSGINNLCAGSNTGGGIVSSNGSTLVGTNCNPNGTGDSNSMFGNASGFGFTTASSNSGVGHSTGRSVASGAVNVTSGNNNSWFGINASSNSSSASGTLALGRDSVSTASTGVTSGDDGPGVSIGSASYPVGFRGDGTIYPSAGSISGYALVKWNGVQYKVALYALT